MIRARPEGKAVKPTRRQFLYQSAALPASWVAFATALKAAAGGPPDEAFWQLVTRQFPLEEGLIYLNAANVCPASRPVLDRYAALLRDFQANPSFQNREQFRPLREIGPCQAGSADGRFSRRGRHHPKHQRGLQSGRPGSRPQAGR